MSTQTLSKSYSIQIDLEKNSWVTQIPTEELEAYANKLLHIGHQVISCSTLCYQPESNLLQPITTQVNSLMGEIQNQNLV